jgi:hypothetical protein
MKVALLRVSCGIALLVACSDRCSLANYVTNTTVYNSLKFINMTHNIPGGRVWGGGGLFRKHCRTVWFVPSFSSLPVVFKNQYLIFELMLNRYELLTILTRFQLTFGYKLKVSETALSLHQNKVPLKSAFFSDI